MAKKATRLKFTEDELANPKVKKAAIVSRTIHDRVHANNQDDNVAVQAVNTGSEAAEVGAHTARRTVYSKKLKSYERAERVQEKSDAANVESIYQQRMAEHPENFSNPLSRMQQRKAIQKEYAAARRAEQTAANAGSAAKESATGIKSIGKKISELKDKAFAYIAEHPQVILFAGALALLLMIVSSSMSSCSAFLPGGSGAVVATTFTANDSDIVGANNDYKALEDQLQEEIRNIGRTHPGYNEYNYYLDEIGHDPYQLAAYLTVIFEDYTRSEVQETLSDLFDLQYKLELEDEVEIRYRIETRIRKHTERDPETGEVSIDEEEYEVEVPYEYYILNVYLTNNDLGHVITEDGGMDTDQSERYKILLETKGNKEYLFINDAYVAAGGDYLDYDIPGEALTDARFANMIREAEKYLGYPYVWGGASPSTSFDCSGFVSWVINHCGNGWDVGRLTANGLKNHCQIIRASEAKPGDLIFFQGTYNTTGASHVGIYVGNGMMIHCGNPIQYASINTSYWQQHFYCFGRIPD